MFVNTLNQTFESALLSSGVKPAEAQRRRRRLEAVQSLMLGNPRQFAVSNPAIWARQ